MRLFQIGIKAQKNHEFDFGNDTLLVECKAYKWTAAGNVPSAKITAISEAMFYFYLASKKYAKYFFVKKEYNPKKDTILLKYFIDCYNHLISSNAVLIDYDTENRRTDVYVYDEDIQRHIKTAQFVF